MAHEAAPAVEGQNGNAPSLAFAAFKPQLVVPSLKADEAVQFYKAAFGAEEVRRVNHPKRKAEQDVPLVLCAELKIGSSALLVCDQIDDEAAAVKVGSCGIIFRLETEDVAGAVAKAVAAGAVPEGEVAEDEGPCGGGLVGRVKDPFGNVWAIASPAKSCAGGACAEPVAEA